MRKSPEMLIMSFFPIDDVKMLAIDVQSIIQVSNARMPELGLAVQRYILSCNFQRSCSNFLFSYFEMYFCARFFRFERSLAC